MLPKGLRPIINCIVRACIMPCFVGKLCHHHFHFFDWNMSMTGRAIDLENLYNYDDPDPAATYFSVLPYWEADVNKFEKTLKVERCQVTFTVDGYVVPNYAPLDAVSNYQRGVDVSRRGWGHKKIRKKQRMRPAGWHGHHPEHKPMKRWSRNSLDDLPIIQPDGTVVSNVNQEQTEVSG